MTAAPEHVDALVEHLFRHKAGQMVAALTRCFGPHNLQLAEDVVQETLLQALQQWAYRGVPENPGGWILAVARNKALDLLRRESSFRLKVELLGRRIEDDSRPAPDLSLADPLGDDQLTMIFMCCHPALPREARLALTLKTVGGFGVPEIARAFLVPEATLAQRLVRARRFIRERQVRFELPPPAELAQRLESVLDVLYLMFNEGYKANEGEGLVRHDICAEAARLCSLLAAHPAGDRPQVHALLALILLQASRLQARIDAEGNLLLLSEQDRAQWDQGAIRAGIYHLERSASGDALTAYHLQAGIAACHATARSYEDTDWVSILHYYNELRVVNSSPVVHLNWAVALAMVKGPQAGLQALDAIRAHPQLKHYYLLPAAYGALLERDGQRQQAIAAYREAIALAGNETERRFFLRRIERYTK
jgi:RNA polymerase sigma-70 factor (ECF subfamily)